MDHALFSVIALFTHLIIVSSVSACNITKAGFIIKAIVDIGEKMVIKIP
jgi:hypothetical protein